MCSRYAIIYASPSGDCRSDEVALLPLEGDFRLHRIRSGNPVYARGRKLERMAACKSHHPHSHQSHTEKASILAAYDASQLSQDGFAARRGLVLSTLARWLRERREGQEDGPPEFVEVPRLASPPPRAASYRLHFARGVVLEVQPGFQAAELRALAELIRDAFTASRRVARLDRPKSGGE